MTSLKLREGDAAEAGQRPDLARDHGEGGVLVGADSMSRAVGVPTYIADVIVAVALLSALVATQIGRAHV